ncbi:hypothetical protein [Microbacterium sp. A84]|uniref:hypothetical protein n=1 Tax=Microbacterium sp. A84 TaxID=3450715 RepID=UPI003F4447A4
MATLEKRVQVLFSAEQYAQLEADAAADRMSMGAYIRQALDGWRDRKRSDALAALERLFERADRNPMPAMTQEEWQLHKEDLLDRPSLRDIP